jgi:hypothetical protein
MKTVLFILLALVLFSGQADAQAVAGNGNRIFIPAADFHHLGGGSATAVVSMHGTPAAFGELSSFGYGGWLFAEADIVSTYLPFPHAQINTLYPQAVRIWYTSSAGAADGSIVWKYGQQEFAAESSSALVAGTAAGLADKITFAADTHTGTTALSVSVTAWDTISSAVLNTYNNNCMMVVGVEFDVNGDAADDEISLLGVEILGVPKDYNQSNFHVHGPASDGLTLPRRYGY